MIRNTLPVLLLLPGLIVGGAALAQESDKAEPDRPRPNQGVPPGPTKLDDFPTTNPPAIEPLGDDRYRIGTLVVDRKQREIRFPGVVSVILGSLEYLACGPRGKLYESSFRADVEAYHVHLALLLIGLEPRNELEFQGDPRRAAGAPVTIEVSWQDDDGKAVVKRAEEVIWEATRKRPMSPTPWVFTGSFFTDEGYAASMTQSIIAVYNDPAAVLNNPLPTGGDDTAYVSHTDALPPQGTEVEFVIRPAAEPDS